jgi:hypothetical protein
MITRNLTRVLMAVGLLCASIAWTGWAYLNTAAAPHRVEDVATAVLADPDARLEIAGPLADQIVHGTGIDPSFTPRVREAVANAMADPRVAANVTAAFGSMHARAVGVDDIRPATIDGALLTTAVRDHLAAADPELAALIPATAVGDLHLPEYHPPFVASLRRIAVSITNWLALAAVALLACALIIGDRKYALRRFGVWAIVTGMLWAIGPRVVVYLAHRWASDADATIDVAVGAATSMVVKVATVLVGAGICSIVVARFVALGQFAGLGSQPRSAGQPVDVRSALWRRQPARSVVVAQARPQPQQRSPAPTARVDTYESGRDRTPIVGQARSSPVAPDILIKPAGWGVNQFVAPLVGPDAPPLAAEHDDTPDIDPWAHFSRPVEPPAEP